jgi:two-component system, OmpR family, response regulator
MKILVAEDDLTMRHLMGTIFRRQGVSCTVVGDGLRVVQAWEREDYDCILMDVQMPLLDGLEATRIIREKESKRGGHTVIIAVTAFAADSDRERCLQAGMDDYISKPIDVEVLFSLLQKHSPKRREAPLE